MELQNVFTELLFLKNVSPYQSRHTNFHVADYSYFNRTG